MTFVMMTFRPGNLSGLGFTIVKKKFNKKSLTVKGLICVTSLVHSPIHVYFVIFSEAATGGVL